MLYSCIVMQESRKVCPDEDNAFLREGVFQRHLKFSREDINGVTVQMVGKSI